LSQTNIGKSTMTHVARFRTVGALGVGAPVTLRGVKVGRVDAVRLAEDGWVDAELTVDKGVALPRRPAVISASSSLFGEWAANIIPFEPLPDDPTIRASLLESDATPGDAWPGATLPEHRAADRPGEPHRRRRGRRDPTDPGRVRFLRGSRRTAERCRSHVDRRPAGQSSPTSRRTGFDRVSVSVATSADAFAGVARGFERTVARVDSATNANQFQDIMNNARASSTDLRQAAADFRSVMSAARDNQASLVHVLQSADSLITRLQSGEGSLGRLTTDTTLYVETRQTLVELRELLADVKANPKRYFKVSVF